MGSSLRVRAGRSHINSLRLSPKDTLEYQNPAMLFNVHVAAAMTAIVTLSHVVQTAPAPAPALASGSCRLLPGDADWPSNAKWEALNRTVGGMLIRGAPLAKAACYATQASATSDACTSLQRDWATLDPL